MTKRVFIIHGWGGRPEIGWYPWLKKELEDRGFEVFIPPMPDTNNPLIEKWVPAVASAVASPDQNTYFVGHSIGCQTILRYLESLPSGVKVGGCVFVAGWFNIIEESYEDDGDRAMAKPWIETHLDCEKVKARVGKVVALFSDDDPFVPVSDVGLFEQRLGAETIVESGHKHYIGVTGTLEIPMVLEKLLKMAK